MTRADKKPIGIPLHGFSLDFMTFSAMSYFPAELNIPLNEAIGLALKEWLTETSHESLSLDAVFDANAIQH